jgi:hypothetical protein
VVRFDVPLVVLDVDCDRIGPVSSGSRCTVSLHGFATVSDRGEGLAPWRFLGGRPSHRFSLASAFLSPLSCFRFLVSALPSFRLFVWWCRLADCCPIALVRSRGAQRSTSYKPFLGARK